MADRDPRIESPRIVIEGERAKRAQQLVDRGDYQSLEAVAEAAFDAFERQQATWDAHIRELVQEADEDGDPGLPVAEAFAEIRSNVRAQRDR